MKSRDKLFLIGLFLVAGNFSGHVTDFGANCGLGLMIFSLALDFLEIRWKSDYKTNTRNMTKPKEGKMTKQNKTDTTAYNSVTIDFVNGVPCKGLDAVKAEMMIKNPELRKEMERFDLLFELGQLWLELKTKIIKRIKNDK